MTRVVVTVDLPAGVSTSPEELRLLWILDQVRRGAISVGKGAELSGKDRWSFVKTMGEHGIPVINYPTSELDQELEALEGR